MRPYTLRPLLLCVALLGGALRTTAQGCPAWPADCPDRDYVNYDRAEDSAARMGNPVLPIEVSMELRLRQQVRQLMDRIAKQEGWEVAQINESASSGQLNADGTAPLKYELRRPHWVSFTYQFVVNKDSLAAYGDWIKEFSNRRLSITRQDMGKQDAQKDRIQAYMDSANYYGQLKAKYMTDHMAQYQQALTSGNKTAIAAFEKEQNRYDKKANEFITRATNLQRDPAAEQNQDNFEQEATRQKLHFRDASLLVIEFAVNPDLLSVEGAPAGASAAPAPGSLYISHLSNPHPDLLDNVHLFTHSYNNSIALIGAWNFSRNHDNNYVPTYVTGKIGWDEVTPKTIHSEQIQAIGFNLSGNKAAIRRFLGDLRPGEFSQFLHR